MTRIGWCLSSGVLLVGLLVAGSGLTAAHAQSRASSAAFLYRQASLRTVVHEVHRQTGYRFLYRDALIAGVSVTLSADTADVLSALRAAVSDQGIRMEVDRTRRQVLLAPVPDTSRSAQTLTGYVVDAQAGERLPRATVVWRDAEGQRHGVVASDGGRVRLRLDPSALPDRVTLVASHVGYEPASVTVAPADPPPELPFRLSPRSTTGPGVTVRTMAFPSALDSTWHGLTRPDLFSPLGEASVLRSLRTLPSVAVTSALSGGMHVRGSQADGFHVQIDGMPIYNQSHLFGLFDAFNDDALRTVGFFADVAPARYRAPPGGTLTFQTRSGAQTGIGGTGELSSTAVSATVDGPLWDGRGSWLLSARRSYLDAVRWFKNDELIAQGVGSNRRQGPIPDGAFPPRLGEEPLGEPSATFYDVHGTLQYEWPSGARLTVSSYAGGDRTERPFEQGGQIIEFGDSDPSTEGTSGEAVPLETSMEWGNEAGSIQLDAALRPDLFTHTTLAVSHYHAQSQGPGLRPAPPRGEVGRSFFNVQNELLDATLKQRLDGTLGSGAWSLGYMGRLLSVRYRTQQILGTYRQHRRAVQGDLFGQYDRPILDGRADAHFGLRLQGVSTGPFGRVSPRVWVEAEPARRLSVTAGYTRNHQFLHRLSAAGDTRVDAWTMSVEGLPPATSDHVTLGAEARLASNWHLRLDGYLKDQRHVRLNEPVLSGGQTAPRAVPWATGRVTARGVEVLHRIGGSWWRWTTSYTLSRAALRLTGDLEESAKPAPWDRRHQGTTRVRVEANDRWAGHLTWLVASGQPNALRGAAAEEPARLAPYHRLDVALQYERRVAGIDLEARVGAFNVYDRDNPRYRQLVGIAEQTPPQGTPRLAGVNVYDLGFQPSFRLAASW